VRVGVAVDFNGSHCAELAIKQSDFHYRGEAVRGQLGKQSYVYSASAKAEALEFEKACNSTAMA
ncbi:MAG: hypothetical protein ACD_28C00026G0004, partial [uncultured bacterium]